MADSSCTAVPKQQCPAGITGEGKHECPVVKQEGTLVSEAMPSTGNGAKKEGEKKTEGTHTSSNGSKKGKGTATQRLKRPMNAFMVWSSLERKRLAEREPHLHNTELSKRLGEMWKGMTEDTKKPFRDEAQKLKAKLMEDHPDYKYRPRRRKDIGNLRHSSCIFGTPTGAYMPGQPMVNGNGYMKIYPMPHPHAPRGYVRATPTGFPSEMSYVYPYQAAATYMSPAMHQTTFPHHFGANTVYPGGYIMQGQSSHHSAHQAYPYSSIATTQQQGILLQKEQQPLLVQQAPSVEDGMDNGTGVYSNDIDGQHSLCSSNMHQLQNPSLNQVSNEHTEEYSSVITTKQEQVMGCDKQELFTQHTLRNGETLSGQPQLMPPLLTSHNQEKPYSSSGIETPPCSPCETSTSIQTFKNTVSSSCTDTKVCSMSPQDKHCPMTSPCVSDGHVTNPSFSLVTPSPDNTTPISGPSPSAPDPYPQDYYVWNNSVYNANNYQAKNMNEADEQLYSPNGKPPPLYHSEAEYHAAPNSKPQGLFYGQYEFHDKNGMGGNGFQCEYQNGIQDEDSLSSSGSGGVLAHDPNMIVGYCSSISRGDICDLPTPELTPTENKCSILTGESNVFF